MDAVMANTPGASNASQTETTNGHFDFSKLPPDILREILDHREVLRAGDVFNLTRSCRAVYFAVATAEIYRRVRFIISHERNPDTDKAQKLISVLYKYPERSRWIHEAEFARVVNHEHCWDLHLDRLLRRLTSLRTLTIRTMCPVPLTSTTHPIRREEIKRLNKILSLLSSLDSLQSLTIEDTCLTLGLVDQLSRLPHLKHLRVRWGYGETAEVDLSILAGRTNRGSLSAVTKVELLTPLAPKEVPVNYILQQYPSLKELTWIMSDQGNSRELVSVPLSQSLALMSHVLVELEFPSIDVKTVMSKNILNFSAFSALKTLRIHGNMILPFTKPDNEQDAGSQLANRLPTSLEVLEVIYDESSGNWVMAEDASGKYSCPWLLVLVSHKSTHFPKLSKVIMRCRTKEESISKKFEVDNFIGDKFKWVLRKMTYIPPEFSDNLRAAFQTLNISLRYKTSVTIRGWPRGVIYHTIEDDDSWYFRLK